MNLTQAYTEIWARKFPLKPPDQEQINRCIWTAGLFQKLNHAHLVDLGTGSGQVLAEAKRRDWTATGYEVSPEVCAWLLSCDYDVRQVDLSTDQLDCESADIVTCCDVIEHLIDPLHAMREAHRILRPGGHVYVGTPNCSCWRRVKSLASGAHPGTSGDKVLRDGGHVGYYGARDLVGVLEAAGFAGVTTHYFNPDPVPQNLAGALKAIGGMSAWLGYTYQIAVGVK